MATDFLCQCAVLRHPTVDEYQKGRRTKVIVAPGEFFVAESDHEAKICGARNIPATEMANSRNLEVVVHRFG